MASSAALKATTEKLVAHKDELERFLANHEKLAAVATERHAVLIANTLQAQKTKALTFKTAVGAAVETADGNIFTGANIENLSRALDSHAEIRAMQNALHAGYSRDKIIALALVYGKDAKESDYAYPACAICRQYMWENGHGDLLVIVVRPDGAVIFAGPLSVLYPLPYPNVVPPRAGER